MRVLTQSILHPWEKQRYVFDFKKTICEYRVIRTNITLGEIDRKREWDTEKNRERKCVREREIDR